MNKTMITWTIFMMIMMAAVGFGITISGIDFDDYYALTGGNTTQQMQTAAILLNGSWTASALTGDIPASQVTAGTFDSGNYVFSDDLYVSSTMQLGGSFQGDSDVFTSGTGDDLWLGTSTQANSLLQLNATGHVKMNNLTMAGSTSITRYASGACRIVNSSGIYDEVTCSQ